MSIMRKEFLIHALSKEASRFEEIYQWMQEHLPAPFFDEMDLSNLQIITHQLMALDSQGFFSCITSSYQSIVLSLDVEGIDRQILSQHQDRVIEEYKTFISNSSFPFSEVQKLLRITVVHFFSQKSREHSALSEHIHPLVPLIQKKHPHVSEQDIHELISQISPKVICNLSPERLFLALDVLIKAKDKDPCQLESRKKHILQPEGSFSLLELTFAWKNIADKGFLLDIAKLLDLHGFAIHHIASSHINPYGKENMLFVCLDLYLKDRTASLDDTCVSYLLQDLLTVKYFPLQPDIDKIFVQTKHVSCTLGKVIQTMCHFLHQLLTHMDPNCYTLSRIEEAVCRHPEITLMLAKAFELKFHPEKHNIEQHHQAVCNCLQLIDAIDTGHTINDLRRKTILKQGINWIIYTLKTNVYRRNKTAFCFRMDPAYLDAAPFDRKQKFPQLPFAIFFMKGLHFTGFHIRFRDLARGGLRTVYPQDEESFICDRDLLFSECYNLAFTQHKKNKDIPEAGAKAVILLEPHTQLEARCENYRQMLHQLGNELDIIDAKIRQFYDEQKKEYLYASQRSYIESFVTLLNCHSDGKLKTQQMIDYYQKPEYIYLGPDENMHNTMITWISNYAKKYQYLPGVCFMSSKPGAGINHKEYGVTSAGINVYMEEVLKFMRIDPKKDTFTIKMTGGPDGDVAGNQMYNLFKYFPATAKLLATIDISGTIFDPVGLDLKVVSQLFQEEKPICHYPVDKLSEGGFLLNLEIKRQADKNGPYQTALFKKENGLVTTVWLSNHEVNHLLRTHVHQVKADIFIPGGGRPRTLSEDNYQDFLDENKKPTSKAIIEGGNLYLSEKARDLLQEHGVLIIKDSSANKGGVICSSFEVLAGLALSEEAFIEAKQAIASQILSVVRSRAYDEVTALLQSYERSKLTTLTHLSEKISQKINDYTDELFAYLEPISLGRSPTSPLIQSFLNYCLPFLRQNSENNLLDKIPVIHQKAVIACFIAQRLVYRKGVDWTLSLLDVLPLILQDESILSH